MYECFDLDITDRVAHLRLNRPDAYNTMVPAFWRELPAIVEDIDRGARARAIVISSTGKHFCAGMDLAVFTGESALATSGGAKEAGRRRGFLWMIVQQLQDSFTALERARMPVLAAVQGGCIGGAVDMVSAADMRYCSADAFFCVQEINIGMTADVGTLQRLPKIIPEGIARELAYTGDRMPAERALACGLVNRVFDDHESLVEGTLEIAANIASKSPLAVWGTKEAVNYTRDHSVADSLRWIAGWQSGMFTGGDMMEEFAAKAEDRERSFEEIPPRPGDLKVVPSSRRPRRLAVVAIVATAAGMATFAAPAGAQDDPAVDPASAPAVGQPGSAADPLVVAVREVQPFTAEREGRWSGFSIDMWEAAADKAGITYEYRRYPDVTAQLAAVTSGEADAALGAISITSEREAVVDFTQPIYDSGIGILATDTEDSDPLRLLASLFTRTLLWLFVMVALLVVVAGHLAWLVERRRNQEHFPRAYGPGVLQGMWWAIVTMTTVGYGDTVARTKAGRLMAAVWMLLSLVVVAQVTAVVTSTLTVERIRGSIDSVADLQGRKVATVRGTTSATYLKGLHISAREAADVDAAVEDLLSGEVDAVVYDEPVLRFQQDTTARGQARLVPVIYQPQGIGMAFTENSPLQEKVSQEFLALRQDGTQETLADRYFGTD